MDIIRRLPPEISIEILRSLNLSDLLNCNAVCRLWYELCNTNLIWKQFWKDGTPLKECNVFKDFDWLLCPPCKWKLYFLNHKKVIHNWMEDRYVRHEINGRWIKSSAYDGKTLVINNYGVEVYRIDNGNLVHCQRLNYQKYEAYTCATNTAYIAVQYKPCVLVYQQINDRYKMVYMLYIRDGDLKLICTNERRAINAVNKQLPLYTSGSDLLCILDNTLFVYMQQLGLMYAWNLKEMVCLMESKGEICDFLYDKEHVYLRTKNNITVYDKIGRVCYTVTPRCSFYKVYVNNHILVAVGEGFNEVDVCAWDKRNGNLLHNKLMNVSTDCLLHPTKDVFIDVIDAWPLEKKEVFACCIKDNLVLWRTLIGEYSILGDLHSIVNDRFLLFCTYSRRIVDIRDTEHGNFLYSLYGIDDDDVFASYDILIYARKRDAKLIVHVYS